jgi:4-amino-4-deoxy-L-arabinose transferase-like glycosyltransferase
MNKILKDNAYLILILLIGFVLRVWGLEWGLPLKKAHIDESVVIFYTMRFFTGDLNPHIFFDYPTLFLYLTGFVYLIYFIIGRVIGIFPSLDYFVGVYLNGDATMFYVLARSLTLILALGSIYLIYKIGKENLSFGIIPALILAVLPIHVLHSHYATVDVACIFFVLWSVLYIARYFSLKGIKDLYIGSLIMGLAVAVKYYPVIFFIPILAAVFMSSRKEFIKTSILSCAAGLAGFLIGCPYSVIDHKAFLSRFIDRFQLIIWHQHNQISLGLFGTISNMINSISPVMFLIVCLGILLMFMNRHEKDNNKAVYILSFGLVYLLFVSTWKIKSVHYFMPALPFFILAGSYGVNLLKLFQKRKTLVYIVFIAVSIPLLFQDIKYDKMLSKRDTRLLAYDWVIKNIPSGSRILRMPYTPEFKHTDPYFVRVDWENKILTQKTDDLSYNYDYIITGTENKELLEKYKIVKEWEAIPMTSFHNPRILIYGKKT